MPGVCVWNEWNPHAYIYIYIYIYIYTYTYIHTHTQVRQPLMSLVPVGGRGKMESTHCCVIQAATNLETCLLQRTPHGIRFVTCVFDVYIYIYMHASMYV